MQMSKIVQHSMKFRVVMMTPEMAQELLDSNHPRNRRPKKAKIEQYSRVMRAGLWELTPEPICVDVDGWTTNGQNRLSACIRAGVEVPMTLITGCPRTAILGQDQGTARNVGDTAAISGSPLPHGANNWAATARAMYSGLRAGGGGARLGNIEVIEFGKVHQKAIEFSFECFPTPVKGITQAAVRAVVARAYYGRNLRTRTREFCEVLLSGLPVNPHEDSGAIRLRNWLIDNFLGGRGGHARHGAPPAIVYAKTERALQAFHNREMVKALQERNVEIFPIDGDNQVVADEDDAEKNGTVRELLNK
jgi:hypothetical protein